MQSRGPYYFFLLKGLQLIRVCLLPSITRSLGGHLTGFITAAPHSLFFGFLLIKSGFKFDLKRSLKPFHLRIGDPYRT